MERNEENTQKGGNLAWSPPTRTNLGARAVAGKIECTEEHLSNGESHGVS